MDPLPVTPDALSGIGVFVLLVAAVVGYAEFARVRRQLASGSWPTVEGVVVGSDVENRGSGEDGSFEPIVEYQYTVDGHTYVNDCISFTLERLQVRRKRAGELVERYPEGATVDVRVDPENPSRSTLDVDGPVRGPLPTSTAGSLLASAVLVVGGVAAIVVGL